MGKGSQVGICELTMFCFWTSVVFKHLLCNKSLRCTFCFIHLLACVEEFIIKSLQYLPHILRTYILRLPVGLGAVAHACNPSSLGGEVSGSLEARRSRPDWPTWWNPISTKSTKISLAWRCMPTVQLLRRVRWDNHLSPGGKGYSELKSRHCTAAWVTDSVSKK